jgi:hypothetical protein
MGSFITPKKSPIAKMQMVASVMGMNAAFQFAALGPRTVQQGTKDAIELARESIGAWKPEIEESRRLTDLGALGITEEQIEKYTNPYLQDVLDFSIQDMEDSAERRRQERKGVISRSGNDFSSSAGAPNRSQIEQMLGDRDLDRSIGAQSANVRHAGFNVAAGLATQERERQARGGQQYAEYGEQTQRLNLTDAGALEHVGELEGQEEIFEREHLLQQIEAYGASAANAQSSVNQYQKTSTLSQIVGAVGSVGAILAPAASSLFDQGSTPGAQPATQGTFTGGFNSLTSGSGANQIPTGGLTPFSVSPTSGSSTGIPTGGIGSLGQTMGALYGN